MSKKEQLYFSLEKITDGRPSVLRNSTFVLIIRILSWLLMSLFLALAVGFFLRSGYLVDFFLSESDPCLTPDQMRAEMNEFFPVFGAFFFCLFIISLLLSVTTKMIHRRNSYILDMDVWIDEYREEQKKQEQPA